MARDKRRGNTGSMDSNLQSRLTKAIEDEKKAHAEYETLAQQVTGEDRQTLLAMAADEHRHQENLQRIVQQGPSQSGRA